MRAIKMCLLSAPACAAVLAISAGRCLAGISVLNQDRTIHIDGNTASSSFSQTLNATAFMPFGQSLQNQVTSRNTITGNATTARTSANQTSAVSLAGNTLHVSVTGGDHLFSDSTQAASDGTSTYSVTFATDAPAQYTLTETTDNPTFDGFFQTDIAATLQPGDTAPLGNMTGLLPRFLPLNMPVTFTGTLAPGTYTLAGGVTGGDVVLDQTGTYAVDFSITSAVSAVPLPKSIWMALTTLGAMIPAWSLRRKLQQA